MPDKPQTRMQRLARPGPPILSVPRSGTIHSTYDALPVEVATRLSWPLGDLVGQVLSASSPTPQERFTMRAGFVNDQHDGNYHRALTNL